MSEKKYVLIAGASSGIGRATAKRLSSEDTVLILTARRVSELNALKEELGGNDYVFSCDFTDLESIQNLFTKIRTMDIKLDGLVYTAGICYTKTIKTMEPFDLPRMFQINVFGFYEMCRLFQSNHISNKGASIVGISSYAAISQDAGMSAYAMTKAAMNTQVKVLSKEFMKRKIRINTIMPAYVMSKMASDNNDWSEEELEQLSIRQPLGVIPIDFVVDEIEFLLSDKSKYITGEAIAINGGFA